MDDTATRLLGGPQPQSAQLDSTAQRLMGPAATAAQEDPTAARLMAGSEPAEPEYTRPAARLFETAALGAPPGAGTAAAQLASPDTPRLMAGFESFMRAHVPKALLGEPVRFNPLTKQELSPEEQAAEAHGPGLVPSIADIERAARRDPHIADILNDEKARREWIDKVRAELPKNFQRRPLSVLGMVPPFGEILGHEELTDEQRKNSKILGILGANQDLDAPINQRVFERLSQESAGPEVEYAKNNPWTAATAQIPGEVLRMAPALGAAAVTGGAGLIPAAATFDAVSQAQQMRAGSQKQWSPEESAVNAASTLSGGIAGRALGNKLLAAGTEAATAHRAAAILSNTVMTGVPTAVEAAKMAGAGKMDWGALLRSLYKGTAEAGILSALPALALGAQNLDEGPGGATPQDRAIAREQADALAKGSTWALEAMQQLSTEIGRKSGQPPPGPSNPIGPQEPAPQDIHQSAQDAVLRAATPEPELKASRERIEQAKSKGGTPEQQSAADAIRAIEDYARNEPPGSALRLHFGSEEFADRMADTYGVTDEANRKLVREHAADLILEPHAKSEKQGGFARVGTTAEEKAQTQERDRDITKEHQRAVGEMYDGSRQRVNELYENALKRIGVEPSGKPLIRRTDPGLERASAQSQVEIGKLTLARKGLERDFHELMRRTDQPESLDRLLTLASMTGGGEGTAILYKKLPENLRDLAIKVVMEFQQQETARGQLKVEKGRILEESRRKYVGAYVHQTYERKPGEPFYRNREGNALEAVSGPTPSSAKRRTKTPQEFIEQGVVKLGPSFREMAQSERDLHRLNLLDYLQNERPDLYMKQSDFVGNVEQTYLKQIEQSKDRLKEVDKLIKAHTKQMAKDGLGIYSGDNPNTLKPLQMSRARLSRELNAHVKRMSERLIPTEGWPEGFNPDKRGNKGRASEIRQAQAKQARLAKELWSHLAVERPKTLMGVEQFFRPGEVEANLKLQQLYDERTALKNISTSTWIQLKSPDHRFARHEGDMIRSDALRDIAFGDEGFDNKLSLYQEASKAFKFNRIAGNPIRSFFSQIIGNMLMATVGGVQLTTKSIPLWIKAAQHAFQYLWSEGKAVPSDPLFHEVVDAARVHGPLALYDAPAAAKESLFKALDTAHQALADGNPAGALRWYVAGLFRAMRYYPGQIPVFGKATRVVAAMDLIPQLAMHYQLRTGEGSLLGKLEAPEALTHTGYFYDMSDVPRWIEKLSRSNVPLVPTFLRFAYKAPTALAKWLMASPPTIGTYAIPGIRLPNFFEKTILENQGTPTATKAIWANKAANLSLNLIKLGIHFASIGAMAAARLGINPNDETYKKRKLQEAGGSAIRAAFLVPYDIDGKGDIKFWDSFNLMPGTSVLSLGQMPDQIEGKGPISRSINYALSLNWLSALGYRLTTQTDFAGHPITPTRSLMDAAANFLPGGFEMPARAVYNALQPGAQKTMAESLFQALTGISIKVGQPGEEARYDLQQGVEGGHVRYAQEPQPVDFEGKMILKRYEANPRTKRMEFERKVQKIREGRR